MRTPRIAWISADDPPDAFPEPAAAFDVPDGLLAAGGDLSEPRLLYAYANGIFPWFSDGQPILWWSPDPRCVIRPGGLNVSRRLARALRNSPFEVSFNEAFDEVIDRCAHDRPGQDGTWITTEMRDAYCGLHENGWAHSIEVWNGDSLIGGLYGLAIDRVFFGESMFSAESNASKAAMAALCHTLDAHQFALLDCQVESPHLLSMGAERIARSEFLSILSSSCRRGTPFSEWPQSRMASAEFLKSEGPAELQ